MIRALWSASTGMKGQQLNVDTIANNLANVNTLAFKKSRIEFKDLMYETIRRSNVDNNGIGSPTSIQIGHGVRPSAIVKEFTPGSLQPTGNSLDLAIDGEGFFAVLINEETIAYTRDGSFKLSVVDGDKYLVTSDGYFVLDESGTEIMIGAEETDLAFSENGTITYKDSEGNIQELARLMLVNFSNPSGLDSLGRNLYGATNASGEPFEAQDGLRIGSVLQGFLETSNVQVVDEMVNLITAQRAYEVNSKVVQASDEMLSQANNLRR